jgi:hypothetical protein
MGVFGVCPVDKPQLNSIGDCEYTREQPGQYLARLVLNQVLDCRLQVVLVLKLGI